MWSVSQLFFCSNVLNIYPTYLNPQPLRFPAIAAAAVVKIAQSHVRFFSLFAFLCFLTNKFRLIPNIVDINRETTAVIAG